MTVKKSLGLALGICASMSVIFYFQKNSQTSALNSTQDVSQGQTSALARQSLAPTSKGALSESPSQVAAIQIKSATSSAHELTEDNLEELVGRCYQGEPCELKEDPWQLYLKFKNSGRTKATDALLSFLRKELRNPKYRDQYKDVLLKMIDDFYTNNLEFQHAAYYYYLGDFQASLELYLKMEKAVASDPSALDPYKLNIANDYYELHRWIEALAYYKKALDEALSEKLRGPDQQMSIHFIQERISELERK